MFSDLMCLVRGEYELACYLILIWGESSFITLRMSVGATVRLLEVMLRTSTLMASPDRLGGSLVPCMGYSFVVCHRPWAF